MKNVVTELEQDLTQGEEAECEAGDSMAAGCQYLATTIDDLWVIAKGLEQRKMVLELMAGINDSTTATSSSLSSNSNSSTTKFSSVELSLRE